MNFPIYFLLISCLSIIIGETSKFPNRSELEKIAGGNQFTITGSKDNINLKLSQGGEIFRNEYALVWKGKYNQTIDVAIKIVSTEKEMQIEMDIYNALEATENFDIKKHRIPRVYYHGPIFGKYFAIAMTLFEETLEDRVEIFEREKKKFSETTILLIYKQAIEGLNYIHSKNVVHNDIKLRNIFIRGEDVFIGDFDSSELDGNNPMEDYASLLFIMFDMFGVSVDDSYYGSSDRILKYFKNKIVHEAFQSILKTPNISGKQIFKVLDNALAKLHKTSGPVKFDWLREGEQASSSGASSKHLK